MSNIVCISLTKAQAFYLKSLLPQGYTLAHTKSLKRVFKDFGTSNKTKSPPKKINTRKKIQKQQINNLYDDGQTRQPQINDPPKIAQKTTIQHQIPLKTDIQDNPIMKTALTIIQKLRQHKNSWMFHKPLNQVKIQTTFEGSSQKNQNNKLDLYTIQKKLKTNKYNNQFDQFQKDVTTMIKDGYYYHKGDKSLITKIKSFQRYCKKLISEFNTLTRKNKYSRNQHEIINQNNRQQIQKPLQQQQRRMTLLQKNYLQRSLKFLKPQHLQIIKQIIFGPHHRMIRQFQLNLNQIPQEKYHQIQKYVKLKLVQLKEASKRYPQKNQTKLNQLNLSEYCYGESLDYQDQSSFALTSQQEQSVGQSQKS